MPDKEERYFKIVLVARMDAGVSTPAYRVKRALETLGHTVFLFTPKRWPELFDGEGTFDVSSLARFLEVQRPDCLLLAEGLGARNLDVVASNGVACGMLCASRAEASSSVGASSGAPLDFAITVSGRSLQVSELEGFEGAVAACAPSPDSAYVKTPLANMVAFGPGVMCVQDATPERVAFFDELAKDERFEGGAVRCFGAGWPERFTSDPSFTHIAYSSRSSAACVVFGSEPNDAGEDAVSEGGPRDALLTDELIVLMRTDGVKLVCIGGSAPWRAERMDVFDDADAARDAAIAAFKSRNAEREPFESRRLPAEAEGPYLEGGLSAALDKVRERLSDRGLMEGLPAPRTVVSVLGYVGMGNFGDEYILATIDRRLRERVRGLSVVAVGENPMHTLRTRGIYSVTLEDKYVLDKVLAASSAALVMAGLLFDQGIRWSIGKAELVSSMAHSDLAGIAAYTELAYLNDARPVFYGIGAGPLDVADGHALVRLMGRVGALFVTRDEATANLIRECRVREEQIAPRADVAFLGQVSPTEFVDRWFADERIDLARSRVVAVSLRDYENAPQDFAQRVASALTETARRFPDVVFAACILDSGDRVLAERISSLLPAKMALRIFDAGDAIEPVADFLSRCSAGLSMRYHCSLLLGSFCKPCVGLGYLPKVVSLYEDLGLEGTLLPMDADAKDMEERLAAVLSFGAQQSFALANRVAELRKKSADAEEILLDAIRGIAPAKSALVPEELFLSSKPAEATEADRLRRDVECERAAVAAAETRRDEAIRERDAARREVEEYAQSYSYRVGSTLLSVPRKVRESLSKAMKREG